MPQATPATGANLGFEDRLWSAADKLRGNMDAAEYKHVVLGLIFLKYISDAFMEQFTALQADELADPEDKDEYLADNIFWVPQEARWSHLQKNAKRPEIGMLVDDAMSAIERDNKVLKGVLPKDYARPALNNEDFLNSPEATLKQIAAQLPSAPGRGAGGEGDPADHAYRDIPGLCKSATLDEIRSHGGVLTPGRYVGAEEIEDDGVPFEEKMAELSAELYEQMAEAEELDATIRQNLEVLGYGE